MPYRNLSLDELARLIGMDSRQVKRLADKGSLPGQFVGGQWRFNRGAMLDWLQREMHGLGAENIRNLERATADQPDQELLGSLIPTEAVEMSLAARSRASVLRELVNLVDRAGLLYDPAALIEALEERESAGSTALPGGLAFPHPRRPLPNATAEPIVCLAQVPAGIAFGAPDGGLTDVFVLVCSHDEVQHLHVLARLSLVFGGNLPAELRRIDDPKAALALVQQTEREVLDRRR